MSLIFYNYRGGSYYNVQQIAQVTFRYFSTPINLGDDLSLRVIRRCPWAQ